LKVQASIAFEDQKSAKKRASLDIGPTGANAHGNQKLFAAFFQKSSACLLFPALLLANATPAGAATIKFCVDQANPMFAVDQAVASAAAARVGDQAAFVVRDSSKDDTDNDSGGDQAKYFKKLAGQCDLIMDFPVEAGHADLPDGMAASVAYARTGFVAAATGALAPDFPAMTAAGKVGVVFLTPASTYFTATNVGAERVYYTNNDLYGALLGGQVQDAVIWQPWLVHQLAAHPHGMKVGFLNMPHTIWDIEAIYPETGGNRAAVRAFDGGIAALAHDGKLAAAVAPYQTP
jgi:hypothetical protein